MKSKTRVNAMFDLLEPPCGDGGRYIVFPVSLKQTFWAIRLIEKGLIYSLELILNLAISLFRRVSRLGKLQPIVSYQLLRDNIVINVVVFI